MSIETPHSHIGFHVKFDELVEVDTIVMRQETWEALQVKGNAAIRAFHEHEAHAKELYESSTINATAIGPISGPEAGTGPLVPAASLKEPALLVANPEDANPNPITIKMEDEPMEQTAASLKEPALLVANPEDANPNPITIKMEDEGAVHPVAAEPMEQPAPTDPVTPEPTEVLDLETSSGQ